MWHAYNLISTGDLVMASTIRKVSNFNIAFLYELRDEKSYFTGSE